MKKVFSLILVSMLAIAAFGQAQKPKLMVVPSDRWCNINGYMKTYDNMGVEGKYADYGAIFLNDAHMPDVISAINNMMHDRDMDLTDLEQTIKSLNMDEVVRNNISSKDGSSVAVSALDEINKRANPDIILELYYTINKLGPKQSVDYNLRALDAATNKQIAGAQGNSGEPVFSTPVSVLLRESAEVNMDEFTARLQEHFKDMCENGREVSIEIDVFDGSEVDLESEFDDKPLYQIIRRWMMTNTVKNRCTMDARTETQMQFSQVRIPLYDEDGFPTNAEMFLEGLQRMLKKAPYEIPSKIVFRSLGKCQLIIGAK